MELPSNASETEEPDAVVPHVRFCEGRKVNAPWL